MKHFGNVSHTTLESREKLHNPLCNMAEYQYIAKGAGKKSDLIKIGIATTYCTVALLYALPE